MDRPGVPRKARTALTVPAVAILLLSCLPFQALEAQDLSYTTVTRAEFGGPMGMMMQMMPEAGKETRQTVHIKGSLMRTDEEDTSSIVDMAQGSYTFLQHPDRTYYTFTLADFQSQMSEAQERMAQENPSPSAAPVEEGSFEIKLSTDRTGRTRDFQGYGTEQVLMTMEVVPVTEEAREMAAAAGTTVFFTEMWISQDFPGAQAYREAQEGMAEEFMEAGGGMGTAMAQVMAGRPDLKEAMEENLKVMGEMQGVPVRTVVHMVMVPPGMTFDGEAVLAKADEPLSSGMGQAAAGAAGEAATDAVRGALSRRMGGLLGRRNQEEEEKPEEVAPEQTITLRTVTSISDIQTGSLPEDLFQPPAEYQERQPERMGGGD